MAKPPIFGHTFCMDKDKKDKIKDKPLSRHDLLKYEIAEELGLMDKIDHLGWKALTAKESGRIGGILARRKKDW